MAGEGGIPGNYVIEARQFDIQVLGITIAQHNFLVLYGPDGSILGEADGRSLGRYFFGR